MSNNLINLLSTMRELLRQIILEQHETSLKEDDIPRAFPQNLIDAPEVLIISGIRRCGKSTLLRQIKSTRNEQDYYLNFDDERLINFKIEHFQQLHEVFIELFGIQNTFYFDEIQNISGWERFVRRLTDTGVKIFITGSNATMLSRELGTHLTGRFIKYELYPFSFSEFLQLRKTKPTATEFHTTRGRANIARELKEYFNLGGFPQYIKNPNEEYLKSLYESIVYRDILIRNKFSGDRELLELAYFLASNSSKQFSYNSLAKTVGLKHSETAKNYVSALESSYLIAQVHKFDYSVKKQLANTKKIYFADTSLIKKIGFNPTENLGPIFENVIFTELQRRGNEIFYHFGDKECDFVIRKGNKIVQALQATLNIKNNETKEREINGLLDAMNAYDLTEGTIITLEEEEKIEFGEKYIYVLPLWKWLLK